MSSEILQYKQDAVQIIGLTDVNEIRAYIKERQLMHTQFLKEQADIKAKEKREEAEFKLKESELEMKKAAEIAEREAKEKRELAELELKKIKELAELEAAKDKIRMENKQLELEAEQKKLDNLEANKLKEKALDLEIEKESNKLKEKELDLAQDKNNKEYDLRMKEVETGSSRSDSNTSVSDSHHVNLMKRNINLPTDISRKM